MANQYVQAYYPHKVFNLKAGYVQEILSFTYLLVLHIVIPQTLDQRFKKASFVNSYLKVSFFQLLPSCDSCTEGCPEGRGQKNRR